MNSTSLESCEDFSNDSRILGIDSFREIYLPSISVIGFIGNILTLFVLRKMKDCFHRLLFALALCDLIVPLFCNHLLFLNLFKQNGNMNMLEIIANAIMEAGFAGSGWMTVTISFERFLGICHPMDFPAASRKARYFVLPVLLIIIIDFCLSAALLGLFGQIVHLFKFIFYPHILIQYIFPAALLLVLNTIILHSVIKINTANCTEGRFMRIPSSASVLIIVVFVYILCWAPFYIIDFTFVFLQSQSGCQGPDGIWVDRDKAIVKMINILLIQTVSDSGWPVYGSLEAVR
jgi:hypothetical protein